MVSSGDRCSLSEKIYRAVRHDVVSGKYKVGEILPGVIELAKLFDVSTKTTRTVLKRLAEGRFVKAVPGTGSIVLPIDVEWRGRVFFVFVANRWSYAFQSIFSAVRDRLAGNGIQVETIEIGSKPNKVALGYLRNKLSCRANLVVDCGYSPDVREIIVQSGLPFVSIIFGRRSQSSESALSTIAIRMGGGLADFYRLVARKNIKSVWQFSVGAGGFDITENLEYIGCRVENFRKKKRISKCAGGIECVTAEKFVMKTIQREFERKHKLPGLVVFGDDHFCTAGLLALVAHGKCIPEDVAVFTFSNRGDEPVFTKPLTKVELDIPRISKSVAGMVLNAATGKSVEKFVEFNSAFIPGETF